MCIEYNWNVLFFDPEILKLYFGAFSLFFFSQKIGDVAWFMASCKACCFYISSLHSFNYHFPDSIRSGQNSINCNQNTTCCVLWTNDRFYSFITIINDVNGKWLSIRHFYRKIRSFDQKQTFHRKWDLRHVVSIPGQKIIIVSKVAMP